HRGRSRHLRVAMRAAQIALCLLLAGCAGSSSSVIDYESRVHVVQPGETLFGIAWRYGLDHRELARWNRLDDPDFIRAGQRLLLTPQAASGAASRPASGAAASAQPSAASRAAASAPPA